MALVPGGNKKRAETNHPWLFFHNLYVAGETLVQIWPTLPHSPRYAQCGSVEAITDSLVERVVMVWKGGDGGGR